MLKPLSALCLFFLHVGCTSDDSGTTGSKIQLELGDVSLSIPSDYFLTDLPVSMVSPQGLDKNSSISLKIPLTDLRLNPDVTVDARSDIIVLISDSTDKSIKSVILPSALAAWNGTGLFKERVIEFDNEVDLFRVYPGSGYPVFWEFFRSSPLSGGEVESEWVAGCWSSGSSGGLNNATCDLLINNMGFSGRISLSGEHIKNSDEIELSFLDMLESWSQ
ncbi:hypothetical protein [Marinobacter shengliensis]